jgi:hypothetical protein
LHVAFTLAALVFINLLAGRNDNIEVHASFLTISFTDVKTDAYRVPASPENALLAGAAGALVFYALCSRASVLIVIINLGRLRKICFAAY